MRRNLWIAAATGAAALLAPALARPATGDAVTLRIEADAVAATAAMEQLTAAFTEETGIQVVVEKFGYADSGKKAAEDLATKAGRYDIVLQNNDALEKFADEGAIYSIEELEKLSGKKADFESDLFSRAWHGLSWYKGVKYGYPVSANTMLVFYRNDLMESALEKAGFRAKYGYDLAPAKDWKEYREEAEYFTRPEQGFYGTLLQGKKFPAVWFEWLNFAFSFGGGVMEKEHAWEYGPIIINSPQTIAATEYYDSLKKFSPPGYTNFTWDDAVGQMRQGHVFECIIWSDALVHVVDPKISTVTGKIGYAPIPEGKAGRVAQIAGASYFVSRYSQHPKEAFQFELWMMGRENQIAQELAGGASARKSVFQDEKVRQLPYAAATAASLEVARNMIDTFPDTPQVSEAVETAVSDVLAGKKTAQASLDWAAAAIHKELGAKAPMKYPVPQAE